MTLSTENIDATLLYCWTAPLPLPPSLNELRDSLQQPLEEAEKIPISRHAWQRYTTVPYPISWADPLPVMALNQLFRISEDEEASNIELHFNIVVRRAPPRYDNTEDTFHAFWDAVICDTLVFMLGDMAIRNSKSAERWPQDQISPFSWILMCVYSGVRRNSPSSQEHIRNKN